MSRRAFLGWLGLASFSTTIAPAAADSPSRLNVLAISSLDADLGRVVVIGVRGEIDGCRGGFEMPVRLGPR